MSIATATLDNRTNTSRLGMALLGCALAAPLFGCGNDGAGTGLPMRISIAPAEPVSLYAGDTLSVRGTIRNSTHTGVTYSSSAPEVASVDAISGLATAIAAGDATITAVSAIDPRVFAQVQFLVLPDLPASIVIDELRAEGGGEADPARISGVIDVRASVERGNARRLQVLFAEEVVCEEGYPTPGLDPPASAPFACTVDTAAFDENDGTPRFLNEPTTLVARLIASGERVLASTAGLDLTLTNPAQIVPTVTAERHALDSPGNDWITGDVLVEALPVLYDAGTRLDSITFAYQTPGGTDTSSVDFVAPFAVTLPVGGILKDVTDPDFRVVLASIDGAGGPGPGGASGSLRYDSSPPTPGTLIPRDWIGAQTQFAQSYTTEGEQDAGVGRMSLRFFAGDPALSSAEIVASGTSVTIGGDLPQAPRQSYRLALEVCDALGNCALRDGYLFGVDLTPPLVESVNIADRTANPGADLSLGVRDDLSGFPDRLLEASVSHLSGNSATTSCGPLVEGIDLPGKPLGGGCAPDTLANSVPVPRSAAGYYSYTIVAFDRAGNRSATVRRALLIDLQPPSLGPLTTPGSLVPGAEFSVSIQAEDDLELGSVDFRLVYGGGQGAARVAIPFKPPVAVGVPFDEVLSNAVTAVGALPFVRSLTYGSGTAGPRTTVVVDSLRVTARDAALLSAISGWWVPRAAFGNDTSTADPFPRFTTAVTTVDRTSVCTASCTAGDPTSLRIAVRVEGESGTGRPFANLHIYRRDATGMLTLVASLAGTDAIITNTGTVSAFVYSVEHVPPPGLSGEFNLLAVGVTSHGNGLVTAITGSGAPLVAFYRR